MLAAARERLGASVPRAALGAALALALAACAGRPHEPDRPPVAKNICMGEAIPAGWIRTNDYWSAKGCGSPRDPHTDNWMTITAYDTVRVGRSFSACAGDVPQGFVATATYWDKGRCGQPAKRTVNNVMLLERVR
jgi:hypothetical protein